MKNSSFLRSLVLLFTIVVALSHCGENSPFAPANPCSDKMPVTSKFSIYETVSDSLFVADTVLQYNTIVFEADEIYSTYEWTIGDDVRVFTTKRLQLHFQQPVGRIDVRLRVTKTPDLTCFADDDGIDELTKSVVVIDWRNSLTIGEYVGINVSNPSQEFEVKLTRELDVNSHPIYNLENINEGCTDTKTPGRGGKVYRFSDLVWYGDGCKGVEGWVTLPTPDSIRIDYSFGDDTKPFTQQGYPRVKNIFKGKRKTI
jgi:hypothetical protein